MADYTHLTYQERQQITGMLIRGGNITMIAKRLGRHRSSLYRELARNSQDDQYSPSLATKKAKARHYRPPKKLATNKALHTYVKSNLEKGWSPEQISGRMKRDKKPFYVCHESIYRYAYTNDFHLLLPKKRKRRRKRAERKITKKASNMALHNIAHRHDSVLSRNEFGHWEGDTIRFQAGQKSCVTTLVERKSRFLRLKKNHDGKSQTVINKICEVINMTPRRLWSTLTIDQGTEFSQFYNILKKTKSRVYFCDSHSPWQRGSNENTNGRLRRYLPVTIQIDEVEETQLKLIEDKLNNTPRKCLNYQTPREVLMQYQK
jgi:transposase, IS30 family